VFSLGNNVLINGTASEVLGMDSETVFKNTVKDRRIVTSVKIHHHIGLNEIKQKKVCGESISPTLYEQILILKLFSTLSFVDLDIWL